jgi:hypothetical protein
MDGFSGRNSAPIFPVVAKLTYQGFPDCARRLFGIELAGNHNSSRVSELVWIGRIGLICFNRLSGEVS